MGLAASQARLLLLTARKSDLEYRAQCITNTEMVLAMQTEAVARKYAEKISNTALFYTTSDATGTVQNCLRSGNFASTALGYKLQMQDADGNWDNFTQDAGTQYYTVDSPIYPRKKDKDGNETNEEDTNQDAIYLPGETLTVEEYKKLCASQQAHCTLTANEYNNGFNELQLLEFLNNGTLRIIDSNKQVVSLSGNNKFTESYYTDDDAQAEAEYKRETAAIQVKEKRLQMELNQIEAQQKACDTEIDSVKKVMEKNVDRTFKVFS